MKTSMRMEWVFVTPAMAQRWLSNNKNRKLRPLAVERLARDMVGGNFKPTHEAVGLYEDGSLADGQHRLNAIVKSGIGQWFWVCHNIPLESRDVIGGVIPRSDFDKTEIAGHDIPRRAIDTIKCVFDVGTSNNKRLTTPEIVGFWEQHKEALAYVCTRFAAKAARINQAAIMAVVFRAYYSSDNARLTEFCDCMYSGKCPTAAEDGVRVLRNFLFMNKGALRPEIYAKAESALVSFLKHQPMTKLYGFSTEQFPLPEETESDATKQKPAA